MSWIYTTDKNLMIVLENIGKPGVRGELENKECSKLTQKFVKVASSPGHSRFFNVARTQH